jgi:hypothetical protein
MHKPGRPAWPFSKKPDRLAHVLSDERRSPGPGSMVKTDTDVKRGISGPDRPVRAPIVAPKWRMKHCLKEALYEQAFSAFWR